ncbi:MAG: hypothetical protein OSA99_07935 [Acidimicrobiales bacterium]|nr:hypothetical protein [Acidimicrobiales bacterium]
MRRKMTGVLLALVLAATAGTGIAAAAELPGDDGQAPPSGTQRSEETQQLREPVEATEAEYREARQARAGRLDELSPKAREIVTTPIEATTVMEAVAQPREEESFRRAYGGHQGNGCWNLKVTKTTENGFGWVLTRAETTVLNYCISNDTFTTTPSTYRYTNAYWGWSTCGWSNTYSGWDGPWYLYRAAGIAKFAYADSCFSPQVQLRNEIAARHDGHWWYWT